MHDKFNTVCDESGSEGQFLVHGSRFSVVARSARVFKSGKTKSGFPAAALAAPAPDGRRPVYPNGRNAQGLRGNYVVIDALPDVKPLVTSHAHPFFREFKYLHARFVAAGLLGGDDVVKCYFELRCGGTAAFFCTCSAEIPDI